MYLLHVTSYSQRVLHVKVTNLQFHYLWFAEKKKKKKSTVLSVVPKPRTLDNFGWAPKLLVRMGRKFPIMGRLPRANPAAQGEVLRPTQWSFPSFICFPRRTKQYWAESLYPSLIVPLFPLCISPSPSFPQKRKSLMSSSFISLL